MRVVSFQSKEVLDIILKDTVYYADENKLRTSHDYSIDKQQLNGCTPIWVFANENLCEETLKSGELLERWRCEMSLDQEVGLTQFVMLELEVDPTNLKHGKTHNAYNYACVMNKIDLSQLCAVYRVEHTAHWYFKKIVLVKAYKEPAITNDELDTRAHKFYGLYDTGGHDTCAFCDAATSHRIGKVSVCSAYCRDKIIKLIGGVLNCKVDVSAVNHLNAKLVREMRLGTISEKDLPSVIKSECSNSGLSKMVDF